MGVHIAYMLHMCICTYNGAPHVAVPLPSLFTDLGHAPHDEAPDVLHASLLPWLAEITQASPAATPSQATPQATTSSS